MNVEVKLPQWGMGMTEGEVVEWLVEVGDKVTEGQPIVEIEAEKVTQLLESPASGTVIEIRAADGETVEVYAVLAVIEAD